MVILPPAGSPPKVTSASSFVPEGEVRHEIFSDTETSTATDFVTMTTNTREVWLTNGKSHLLVRENKDQKGDYWLLGENTVWSYNPSIVPTIVYTYPYDPKELKDFLPDSQVVTKTQQEVGTHVVGADVIQGRPAILIERTNNITPGSPVDQTSGGIQLYRFWIDTNTYQVIQWEYDKRESANGVYTDKVDTSRVTMTLDELLNADQVPPDLFAFVQPRGTWVIRDPSVSYGP
jgi:outer membrane lipoprotein-sorting protein